MTIEHVESGRSLVAWWGGVPAYAEKLLSEHRIARNSYRLVRGAPPPKPLPDGWEALWKALETADGAPAYRRSKTREEQEEESAYSQYLRTLMISALREGLVSCSGSRRAGFDLEEVEVEDPVWSWRPGNFRINLRENWVQFGGQNGIRLHNPLISRLMFELAAA